MGVSVGVSSPSELLMMAYIRMPIRNTTPTPTMIPRNELEELSLPFLTFDGGGAIDTCVPGTGGVRAYDESIAALKVTPPRLTDWVQLAPFQ